MKFNIILIAVSSLFISVALHAKPVVDSVGVKNQDGKKVVLFKVKPKDTYYSIGRRYNVKPAVIMKFNDSKKETLTIGEIVKVPTDMPYKKSSKSSDSEKAVPETKKEKKARLAREAKDNKKKKFTEETETPASDQQQDASQETQQASKIVDQPVKLPEQRNAPSLQYKVAAGETLYGIAKRFNTSVDNIRKQNNLSSNTLAPGQVLIIKPYSDAPQATTVVHSDMVAKRDSTVVAPAKDSSTAERRSNANRFGLYEKNEKGVATWIDDTGLDPNKKLVLHRTAPIGTVIKITNPMTNRTTFAKVVGRFTDNEATKDVIIVMTKNVADSLGALDKRFHVNISYGSPNE
ncbi:MAG TPA: LysM peptidoglycan-binding domain-containing protein [Mucilaginibacter sp.]|jgi:LysM repeat protein|nr:LysM peptidoglycan-binding domain-containing protein [Mucilaginibacter sp.]